MIVRWMTWFAFKPMLVHDELCWVPRPTFPLNRHAQMLVEGVNRVQYAQKMRKRQA